MTICILALAGWLFLGWKLALVFTVGACLEAIEAAVLHREISKLRRENAELAKLARGLAHDLENSVETYLEGLHLESGS
jgi:NhaP-type Na+/H+ or K+/H+ antiporter